MYTVLFCWQLLTALISINGVRKVFNDINLIYDMPTSSINLNTDHFVTDIRVGRIYPQSAIGWVDRQLIFFTNFWVDLPFNLANLVVCLEDTHTETAKIHWRLLGVGFLINRPTQRQALYFKYDENTVVQQTQRQNTSLYIQ